MTNASNEAAADVADLSPICAIGASAGGVGALQHFFRAIAPDLGLAYVVVVHLAPDFPSQLAEIIAGCTTMPVHQVSDTPELKPDCVYVIGPDRELVIEGNNIRSRPFHEPRGQRAPIDMFFRSVASARGDGYAVVLTGAGSDGAVGVRKIKESGGVIMVQDPAEAEFPMMPRSAIATGVADFIAPIAELTERIAETLQSKKALALTADEAADREIARILGFLRSRTGHDFASYKSATVRRRIGRRMQVTRQPSLADYSRYLTETPEEAQELLGDLLISVTSFFRDPSAFDVLAATVIPALFDRGQEDPIRMWSVGCATGEEAYSLAILVLEEADKRGVAPNIQIFASDLDEGALATAREGRYPRAIEADVSEERLERYFVAELDHYRVRKEVRNLVLFAHHSGMKDPPFMRMNLISCRNLLIYLQRELQGQLLALFHYALRPGCFLFLGSAESADVRPELYAAHDREARLYTAKPRSTNTMNFLNQLPRDHRVELPPMPSERIRRDRSPGKAHIAALEKLAPPSALVDEEHRVINLSANAGRFIRPPEGPMSNELSDIVRPELRSELKSALHRALLGGETTVTLPVNVEFGTERRRILMFVAPSSEGPHTAPQALVLFMDAGAVSEDAEPASGEGGSAEMQLLRDELRASQERLGASRREHESSAQELRIANEELQSVNEEYRSTAEELETSKEELQSINEELQTVNSELKSKLDNIASAHSDLQNLINATEIGTLFLDGELRIKMLTPAVEQLFSVTDSDVGRPITDFTHRLVYDGVERDARKVLKDLSPFEDEVLTKDGRWLMMRLRPYRTMEDRIEGIVLSFVEITQRREAEERLRASEERYRHLLLAMEDGYILVERDASKGVPICSEANPAATSLIGSELEGRPLRDLDGALGQQLSDLVESARDSGETRRIEIALPTQRWADVGVIRIDGDRSVISFRDITAQKTVEKERDRLAEQIRGAT